MSARQLPQNKRYTQTESEEKDEDILCKWKSGGKKENCNIYTRQMDFKTNSVIRDKEKHYIMLKGLIQ